MRLLLYGVPWRGEASPEQYNLIVDKLLVTFAVKKSLRNDGVHISMMLSKMPLDFLLFFLHT